ncbi:MAG: hypothetical protein GTN99_03740 [Candidatus Dadabacteria bacterium]|nr:hypothetical protein [Candidatus Dadabacteria bacterium]
MIVTTHQPIFLPWPGLFYKASNSDCMVLLDDVQFPLGRGWVNRNRLKYKEGEMFLTVPVRKKGRAHQLISGVEIFDETGWRAKHLETIYHCYCHAPYFKEYFSVIESIYAANHFYLIDLNLELIKFFFQALGMNKELYLLSELDCGGRATDLIIDICKKLGADTYLNFPIAEKHLDLSLMENSGIEHKRCNFKPPVYPQLWGEFIYNLSALDMLFNCGEKSRDIICSA